MPRFRSKFEKRLALALERAGVSFGYETERIGYLKQHHYTPDFVLENGVMLEAKGRFLASDRAKHLLVKKQHPEMDIRFVFMRASNTLTKRSKTTYGDWCDKHGFLWCENSIPRSWFD
ncbi:hypothetical protein OAL22_00685 [bacterium]|jgi:hypothetical protein|nr:hypothetical protein [bacterium]